jgi:uncharacterized protein YjbK
MNSFSIDSPMSDRYREVELSFKWNSRELSIKKLKALHGWNTTNNKYIVKDSIYDTKAHELEKNKTGARIRSAHGETTLTIKKFIKKGVSGENIFDEYNQKLQITEHPVRIPSSTIKNVGVYKNLELLFQFTNHRNVYISQKNDLLVRIINEHIVYSNNLRVIDEYLLEIEFEGDVGDDLISAVKREIINNYDVSCLHEGKTDRAKRLLKQSQREFTKK